MIENKKIAFNRHASHDQLCTYRVKPQRQAK